MACRCVAIHLQFKTVKVTPVIWNEGHTGYYVFLPFSLRGPVPIWLNHLMCEIHTTNGVGDDIAPPFQDERSRPGSHMSFEGLSCLLCSPALVHRVTSCEIHTQTMRAQCVAHHFQVKRSMSHGSCGILIVSAPWLSAYLIELLHMWHICNTRGRRVEPHFQGEG